MCVTQKKTKEKKDKTPKKKEKNFFYCPPSPMPEKS
jgi:hypothetical protein